MRTQLQRCQEKTHQVSGKGEGAKGSQQTHEMGSTEYYAVSPGEGAAGGGH